MTNPNEAAAPFGQMHGVQPEYGLTKREYMASQILAGIVAGMLARKPSPATYASMAKDAVAQTDALIAELNKERP